MADFKIPKELHGRLGDVARAHNLGDADKAAAHFVTRGLAAYRAPGKSVKEQLAYLVEEQGYSSGDEAVEHLLIRGLRAYEESAASPEELAARLRGLGYID
jgi:hypothetical protein